MEQGKPVEGGEDLERRKSGGITVESEARFSLILGDLGSGPLRSRGTGFVGDTASRRATERIKLGRVFWAKGSDFLCRKGRRMGVRR